MIKRLRMRRGPCDKAIASWKADHVQLSDYLQECAKWVSCVVVPVGHTGMRGAELHQ